MASALPANASAQRVSAPMTAASLRVGPRCAASMALVSRVHASVPLDGLVWTVRLPCVALMVLQRTGHACVRLASPAPAALYGHALAMASAVAMAVAPTALVCAKMASRGPSVQRKPLRPSVLSSAVCTAFASACVFQRTLSRTKA
jgi:hypothetical protein